jgi:hypothetical protein
MLAGDERPHVNHVVSNVSRTGDDRVRGTPRSPNPILCCGALVFTAALLSRVLRLLPMLTRLLKVICLVPSNS